MSKKISLWSGLIVVIATIPLIQDVAVGKSSVEVQRIAKQVTVQISNCGFGSGVIIHKIANTYTVLTVAHAVKISGCTVTAPDDTKYQVDRVKVFPNKVDLAVFTFTSNKKYPVAKLITNSDLVEVGETIYISGFPFSSVIKDSIFSFVSGLLVSNVSNKQQGNGYSLLYYLNTLPGHSGSPIWNKNGELIGIHGRGDIEIPGLRETNLAEQQTINDSVRVKTNYSIGITVNTFIKLAKYVGLNSYHAVVNPTKLKTKIENDLHTRTALIYLNSPNSPKTREAWVVWRRKDLLALDRAIESNDINPKFYMSRGDIKVDLEDNLGALADYNRALSLDPKLTFAYHSRGLLKANKLNDISGALADYDRELALSPNYTIVYASRGFLKANKLNDISGALADYDRAIALNNYDSTAYYGRGLLKKTKLNDSAGALADYNEAIAIIERDVWVHLNPNALRDMYFAEPYYDRGILKANELNDRAGATNDLKRAAKLFKQQGKDRSYKLAMDALKKIK